MPVQPTTQIDAETYTTGQLPVETKFMQGYRVAQPVHALGDMVSIRNRKGELQLFTVATDGRIWNHYPDPASSTGYTSEPLKAAVFTDPGIQGAWAGPGLAAALDSDGRIVLFYRRSNMVFSMHESPYPDARWSPPLFVGGLSQFGYVAAVFAQNIDGHVHLGVVGRIPTQNPSPGDDPFSSELAYCDWKDENSELQRVTFKKQFAGPCKWAWMGNTADSAAVMCASTSGQVFAFAFSYNVKRASQEILFAQGNSYTGQVAQSMDAAVDSTGQNRVFAVIHQSPLNPKTLAYLSVHPDAQSYWKSFTKDIQFRQIEVQRDAKGLIHIFGVAVDKNIYHVMQDASRPSGYTDPQPIFANAARIAVARDDQDNIDIFVAGPEDGTLTHLYRQTDTWQQQTLEVPVLDKLEEYITYSSDVAVLDAKGMPLVHEPVSVWTSSEARLTINGATYYTYRGTPAQVTTGPTGMLSITQETDSLGAPAIEIRVPKLMAENSALAIEQFAVTQNKLTTVTGPDLLAAKDTEGGDVFKGSFRTKETTDDLAKAFRAIMALPVRSEADRQSFQQRDGSKPGVHFLADAGADLSLLPKPHLEQHWSLTFDFDGKVRFKELTGADATAAIHAARASAPKAGEAGWFGRLIDFVRGVVNGAISIAELILSSVKDAITAVFHFVLDGVKYVFETIIAFVQQAFELVDSIIAAVKTTFRKAFEWLGNLFNWVDILRSQEALIYTVNQVLGCLELAVPDLIKQTHEFFGKLDKKVRDGFTDAIAKLAGNSTLGGVETSNRPKNPGLNSAVANNVVLQGFVSNVKRAKSQRQTPLLTAGEELEGMLDSFIQDVGAFTSDAETKPQFSTLQDLISAPAKTSDQILTMVVSKLLLAVQGLVQVILSGVEALVTKMLDLFKSLLTKLRTMLNESWDIPLLSPLYGWITQHDGQPTQPLTMLGLVTMVIAIPTTPVYKLFHDGKAPFPEKDSVDKFKATFNAQSLFQRTRLGAKTGDAAVQVVAVPREAAQFIAYAAAGATFCFGIVTAVNDAAPPPMEPPKIITAATLILEWCGMALSAPWWAAEGVDWSQSQWFCELLGSTMDAIFVVFASKLPENFNDGGVFLEIVYAVFHALFALASSLIPQTVSAVEWAANFLPIVPEFAKFGRLTAVVTATEGLSLIILGCVDGLFYAASGAIQLFVADHIIGEARVAGVGGAAILPAV